MDKQERKECIEQAREWRFKVALIFDTALPKKIVLSDSLMRSWLRHVDLLKKVYPEQKAQDKIKVEILEYYPRFKRVLQTSFPDISSYIRACDELGWPYKLDSEQIGECHYCQQFYYAPSGCDYEDDEELAIEFCDARCLENYQVKCAEEAASLEYMMECFPDQYEKIDEKIQPKTRTPQQQKAFRKAWEHARVSQVKEKNHDHPAKSPITYHSP